MYANRLCKCTPHYALIRRYSVCVVQCLYMFVEVSGQVLELCTLCRYSLVEGGFRGEVGDCDSRQLSLRRFHGLTVRLVSVISTVVSAGQTTSLICYFVWALSSRWCWWPLVHSFLGLARFQW